MKKRFITLLTAIIVATLLSGCTSNSGSTTTNNIAKKTTPATTEVTLVTEVTTIETNITPKITTAETTIVEKTTTISTPDFIFPDKSERFEINEPNSKMLKYNFKTVEELSLPANYSALQNCCNFLNYYGVDTNVKELLPFFNPVEYTGGREIASYEKCYNFSENGESICFSHRCAEYAFKYLIAEKKIPYKNAKLNLYFDVNDYTNKIDEGIPVLVWFVKDLNSKEIAVEDDECPFMYNPTSTIGIFVGYNEENMFVYFADTGVETYPLSNCVEHIFYDNLYYEGD